MRGEGPKTEVPGEAVNILVAVHNLTVEKCHLMPWRTVSDVVKHMREDGHNAFLVSLGDEGGDLQGASIPVGTRAIRKHPGMLGRELDSIVKQTSPDILFWPVAWRESNKRIAIATESNVPVVLWFPGGVYSLESCFHAVKVMGVRNTLPYLREVLSNRKRQVAHFKRSGVRAVLAMTEATARSAVEAGWPQKRTFVIPPGKEHSLLRRKVVKPPPLVFQQWLGGNPFYLFMGPPSGIRGIFDLIEAFDVAASRNQEIRLVCLFRADGLLDRDKVNARMKKCRHKDRMYAVWQSLSPEELNGYMASCHAVTMPFVMVPSEIPLAIIESMAWGKPIITTSPGGTAEFVMNFGLAPKVGDIHGLADAIVELRENTQLYQGKCQNCLESYELHPEWREVSRRWVALAEKALGE